MTRLGTHGNIRDTKIRLIALVFWALLGCQHKEFIPDGKFVDLYTELKLVTVVAGYDLDKANEMRRVILAQHQMTPAQFHGYCVELQAHPEAWRKFQEQVVLKVEEFRFTRKGD